MSEHGQIPTLIDEEVMILGWTRVEWLIGFLILVAGFVLKMMLPCAVIIAVGAVAFKEGRKGAKRGHLPHSTYAMGFRGDQVLKSRFPNGLRKEFIE